MDMHNVKIRGLFVSQRIAETTVELFVFSIKAKDLVKWSGVKRVGEVPQGTQRIITPARLTAVRNYLAASKDNILPNSILIAFDNTLIIDKNRAEKLTEKDADQYANTSLPGSISFDYNSQCHDHEKPALVVDGQHRLYGAAGFNEDVSLIVVALLNATPIEQAFNFIIINNKISRVSLNNIRALLVGFNEDQLAERLAISGVSYADKSALTYRAHIDSISPFKGLVNWPLNTNTKDRIIHPSTIEGMESYLKSKMDGIYSDDDTIFFIMASIWSVVKSRYDNFFKKNSFLMRKVSMLALNESIADNIMNVWYSTDVENARLDEGDFVKKSTELFLRQIPEDFWTATKNEQIKIQDNSNIREIIKTSLIQSIKNVRQGKEWKSGIPLFDLEEA